MRVYMPRYDLAIVKTIESDLIDARQWLQGAINAGWRGRALAVRDPLLQNLHGDPVFIRLMADVERRIVEARQRMV